jgi:hypothetical protein
MSFTTTRFFYNTDAPEMPSIASMMAKSGVNSTDESVQVPNIITTESGQEKKDAPQAAAAATPVETTNVQPIAEEGKPESPKQTEEKATPTPQKEEVSKVPTLQEVLKSQQPDTVLKELGYDDKVVKLLNTVKENEQMLAFFEHWMNNGNTSDYLRELNTDYSKMSAEDVLKQQLMQEYPKASEKALNALFKAEVLEKYKLDPDTYSEEEVEESRLLLEARADKYRETLVANQQKFLVPKPPEPKAAEPDLREQQAIQALEAYKSQVVEHETSKNILANKFITIGEGDEKVNIPLSNPQRAIELLTDADKWAKSLQNSKGENDIEKQLLVAAFADDPKGFLKEHAKHFLSLGGKKAIDPIENAKEPEKGTAAKSDTAPTSPAAAMAKAGVVR